MGAQTLSVRISDEDIVLAQRLMDYHHKLGDIPKPTASEYLKYLFVRDVEHVVSHIAERRSRMQG